MKNGRNNDERKESTQKLSKWKMDDKERMESTLMEQILPPQKSSKEYYVKKDNDERIASTQKCYKVYSVKN